MEIYSYLKGLELNYLNNPFVQPTPLETIFLKDLSEISKSCVERQWSCATAGNFSIRVRSGLVWLSPSGVNKSQLSVRSFIPVEETSGLPKIKMSAMPSEESSVHLSIYNHYANARCVVHLHPPKFVKASISKTEIIFQRMEMLKALGCLNFNDELTLRIAPNKAKEDLVSFCNHEISEYFNTRSQVILFSGHGIYAWGQTPYDALHKIEAIESLCNT